jgi:hypothetical protein
MHSAWHCLPPTGQGEEKIHSNTQYTEKVRTAIDVADRRQTPSRTERLYGAWQYTSAYRRGIFRVWNNHIPHREQTVSVVLFLLVTIQTTLLFAFVRRDLLALTFLAGGHVYSFRGRLNLTKTRQGNLSAFRVHVKC